jgi:hypothetical protein
MRLLAGSTNSSRACSRCPALYLRVQQQQQQQQQHNMSNQGQLRFQYLCLVAPTWPARLMDKVVQDFQPWWREPHFRCEYSNCCIVFVVCDFATLEGPTWPASSPQGRCHTGAMKEHDPPKRRHTTKTLATQKPVL